MMTKVIGLLDIDFKQGRNVNNTKGSFPNLALMKISGYYKEKGYKIEWYSPVFKHKYHKIFASKVFRWKSEMDGFLTKDMIKGGSGFDLSVKLPEKIEHCRPDYNLYGIDYAIGFITRGCSRRCDFCVVSKKEGMIHKHADLDEFWSGQDKIMLLDNNILSYTDHLGELVTLRETGSKVQFNQGLDIRFINKKNASLLFEIPRWKGKRYNFAFDHIGLKKTIEKKLKLLYDIGFTANDFMFYLLIGFDSTEEEDLERIQFLKNNDLRAYAMPYDSTDPYQRSVKRWTNFKPYYWKMSWEEYLEHDKDRKEVKDYIKTKAKSQSKWF